MSYESAFIGDTYDEPDPACSRSARVGSRSAISRSIAHRNAASVLPDPVGAEISTCSPEAIAGHACSCAAVGCSKAPANHSRVRALKSSSGGIGRA